MPEPKKPARAVILIAYNNGIVDVFTDDGPLDVLIATVRKDGQLTGRPTPMLATHNPAKVEEVFQRLLEGA